MYLCTSLLRVITPQTTGENVWGSRKVYTYTVQQDSHRLHGAMSIWCVTGSNWEGLYMLRYTTSKACENENVKQFHSVLQNDDLK